MTSILADHQFTLDDFNKINNRINPEDNYLSTTVIQSINRLAALVGAPTYQRTPVFKNKNNVFVLRTFSKMFGLASLRVGWGYGSKKIINALNVIKPPFNVNCVAQLAAAESLKDKKFITKSIKHNLFYAKKIKKFLESYHIYTMCLRKVV